MFFSKKDKSGDGKKPKALSKEEKEKQIRKLRDTAAQALEKGKHEHALEAYREWILLEPKDADLRRKLADLHRTLGNKKEELDARCLAATLYAEDGFLLKGVAMCKMALALDPSHLATQKKLAELNALSGAREERSDDKRPAIRAPHAKFERPTRTDARTGEPPRPQPIAQVPAEAPARPRSIPPGAPLEAVPLVSIVPPLPAPLLIVPGGEETVSAVPESMAPESVAPESIAPESEGEIYVVELDAEPDVEIDEELKELEEEVAGESESEEAREAVLSALTRTPLLNDLNEVSFIKLVERVQFIELSEGEVLFHEGELADAMYAVAEGEVAASVKGPPHLELARLGEGEFFGEIGLLAEQPRQATITATRPTQVLRFERDLVSEMEASEPEFIRILLRFVRERLVASLVATSPLFAPFAGGDTEDLTRRFRFLEAQPSTALIKQGTSSEGVFILLTGGAKVLRAEGDLNRELSALGPGDVFGEMSLINRENAVASVITTAKSFVLQLPAKDFTQLIMMHPAVLDYVSTLAGGREQANARVIEGNSGFNDERLSLL